MRFPLFCAYSHCSCSGQLAQLGLCLAQKTCRAPHCMLDCVFIVSDRQTCMLTNTGCPEESDSLLQSQMLRLKPSTAG